MKEENQENSWRGATYRAGRDVDLFVDDAIRSGDYSSLSDQINAAMNKAVDAMHDSVFGQEYRTGRPGQVSAYEKAKGQARDLSEAGVEAGGTGSPAAFGTGRVRVKAEGAARVEKLIGQFGFAINLLLALMMFFPAVQVGLGVFFGVAAGLFRKLERKGREKIRQIEQANRILQVASGRDVVSVEEIASALGTGKKETRQILRDLLKDGVLEGTVYLDRDRTTLMLSPEAYRQYQTVMADYQRRKREDPGCKPEGEDASVRPRERASAGGDEPQMAGRPLKEFARMTDQKKEREKRDRKLDEETRQILEEGRNFIAHIHQKNDEIPGEEISAKLDRLERIVRSIFDQVEKNPEAAPDLHKLMSYYLPTTRKLIDTYAALDKQQVVGANIESAKAEIENSMDTINDAYEKLFDSFFRNTAWDVGTDVSVMKTMLRQDGLTEDEFQEMKKSRSGQKKQDEDRTEDLQEAEEPGLVLQQGADRQ